jgi:hypothetical protein
MKAIASASKVSNLPVRRPPMPRRYLIASIDWIVPITPATLPKTPASEVVS